jgi:tetratricopeptide (TPR) repeat protein
MTNLSLAVCPIEPKTSESRDAWKLSVFQQLLRSVNQLLNLKAAGRCDHLAVQCCIHQQMTEAASYYRQALAIRENVFGPSHLDVADSQVRLAGVLGWRGRESPEAESLWEKSAAIYEHLYRKRTAKKDKLFERVFMGLSGVLGNLANREFSRGNLDEAEKGYRRIQAMIEENYGTNPQWLHPSLPSFARVLVRRGKNDEAERLLWNAINRTAKVGSLDEWIRVDCEKILRDFYVSQGRTSEANSIDRPVD